MVMEFFEYLNACLRCRHWQPHLCEYDDDRDEIKE